MSMLHKNPVYFLCIYTKINSFSEKKKEFFCFYSINL